MAVAQRFNDDYGRNLDGPVYDRWDARSKAVIGRAEYLRRHAECPTAPQQPATVESAAPGPDGTWLVHYRIGDQQFVDHWLYSGGRWQFDLLLEQPRRGSALPAARRPVRRGRRLRGPLSAGQLVVSPTGQATPVPPSPQ